METPFLPIPYNDALLQNQRSALNRFMNSWLLMPSGKQVEHASHISEHLSQSLTSLVREEGAISWPKRTLHRFKWFCLVRRPYSNVKIRSFSSRDSFAESRRRERTFTWDRSDDNCGKALRRGAPPRVQIPHSNVAEKGDASVQVVWVLQNVLFTSSFFLWRRWKEVGFSHPKLWLKFQMKILTEKPSRPGHYQVWALNDAKDDKVRFARLLAFHLNI